MKGKNLFQTKKSAENMLWIILGVLLALALLIFIYFVLIKNYSSGNSFLDFLKNLF